MLSKLFGNKTFYKNVFHITLPIMLQQVLINIVGLADNLMVGQLSEDVISGVYIATKILFVVNLAIFGAVEGASIFFAQFVGSNDNKHIKQCFNYKMYADILIGIIGMFIIFFFGKGLSSLFINDYQSDISASYLKVYSICVPFFVISVALSTCYRETNKSTIPMIGSLLALFTNIGLNYVFIFVLNKGAVGAAIATVIARFLECSYLCIYSLIKKPTFFNNIFKSPKIDIKLFKETTKKSIPLLLNEILWSSGQIMLVFAFSKVSELASPALSISQTLFDVFYMANIALGNGIAVIMGNTLGQNDLEEVKKQTWYFNTLTIIISIIMGLALYLVGPLIANYYNVSDEVRQLAVIMCTYNAILMPIMSLNCAIFFMIRSGGFTSIVLVFDSLFVWCLQTPTALILALCTNIELPIQFLIVYSTEIIKLIVGSILLKSGVWIRNLTINHSN